MSSSEEQQAKLEKQLVLNLQLDRMTQQAFGSRTHAPKKPLTKTDEKAILEYNKQFKTVQYEMEDDGHGNIIPVLDDDGKPVISKKKFISIPPPALEAIDVDELKKASNEDILDTETHSLAAKEAIEVNYAKLKATADDYKFIEETLNNLAEPVEDASLTREKNEEALEAYRIEREKLIEALLDNEDEQKAIGEIIENITDNYYHMLDFIKDQQQGVLENDAYIHAVQSRNAKLNQEYQDALNLLNKGAFQMVQGINESETEFQDRIIANAEQETTDEQLFEAQEYTRNKFKENLKELVRKESVIESVANQLKSAPFDEEDEIEMKTLINKQFPGFKTLFIETFGKNNREIDAGDIIQFIKQYASEGGTAPLKTRFDIQKQKTTLEEVAPSESVYVHTIQSNGEHLYLMPITDDNGEGHLLWSRTGKRNTFKEILDANSIKEIRQRTGITLTELRKLVKTENGEVRLAATKKKKIQVIDSHSQIPYTEDNSTGPTLYGWGVKPEAIPDEVSFGKIKIMLHKLYYKNNLVVKRKDGTNIVGMPNIRVSDDFVRIIMKIVKGNKITHHELEGLKTVELHLYNRLITLADLHKSHQIDSNKTVEHLKHRMELLVGEIQSGNDARDVKKELFSVVHSLKEFGVINSKAAIEFLKQFK